MKANYESVLLGQGPTEKAALGDTLKQLISDLIDVLKTLTIDVTGVTTGAGVAIGVTSATVSAPQLDAISAQLNNILATQVKVK